MGGRRGWMGWLLARIFPQTKETSTRGIPVDFALPVRLLAAAALMIDIVCFIVLHLVRLAIGYYDGGGLFNYIWSALTICWWPGPLAACGVGGLNFLIEVWWPFHQQEKWSMRMLDQLEGLFADDEDIDVNVPYERPTYTENRLSAVATTIMKMFYTDGASWSRANIVRDCEICTETEWKAVMKQFRNRGIITGEGHGKMAFKDYNGAWAQYLAPSSGQHKYIVNEEGELVPM